MTATDELSRLLDKRGAKHYDMQYSDATEVWWGGDTFGGGGAKFTAYEQTDGFICLEMADLTPEQAIAAALGPKITGDTSDGYHTFNELYHHRAVLFSVIVRDHRELAWKSMRHHDGTMYDGMFIVGIETPEGQATYHYDIDPYWDMFNCKELDQAPEWDGHTPSEAIERIATLGRGTCQMELHKKNPYSSFLHEYVCSECGESMCRYTFLGQSTPPIWCPSCGRKVVDE